MFIERKKALEEFQEIIGVKFNRIQLLDTALTHSSYANQQTVSIEHNERLEFLGDSVLSMIVSEYLYKKYYNKQEGKLTRIRASVVCEPSLAEMAKRILINKYIRIGKGEELSGGRGKDSLLADACEAVIAAVYIDAGFDKARDFVLSNLIERIEAASGDEIFNDYKSRLQEYIQKKQESNVKYVLTGESGPPHNKTFDMEVIIDGNPAGKGSGRSKKEAEQRAAKKALEFLGVDIGE